MTIKTSTGLRNKMLDTGSFKATFATAKIMIYSGAVPADADAAVTGALLATITGPTAAALIWDTAAASGVLAKSAGQVWSGTVSGTTAAATYYRLVDTADATTLSTTAARVQGTVASAGGDLNLSNTTLTNGATQTIDYYTIALPTT